jgi:hypothetical protein
MVVRLPTMLEEAPDHNVNQDFSGCWERPSILTKYKTRKIRKETTKNGKRTKVKVITNATNSSTQNIAQSLPKKKNKSSQSFTLLAMMHEQSSPKTGKATTINPTLPNLTRQCSQPDPA